MTQRPLEEMSRARTFARRLRLKWERRRPIPKPGYISGTPKTGGRFPLDAFSPPNALTLAAAALSEEAVNFVKGVLQKLTPSEEITGQLFFYSWRQGKFGPYWRYADLTTVLRAASLFLLPSSYLEIGVRRGRSAAVVAATCPDCSIYGFDVWIPDFAGAPNPGPEFVRSELRAVGHEGEVVLIEGDSRKTVPSFLREHPDLFFDLITVDGDHSTSAAAGDLAHCLPRLKVGGIVVMDDICLAPQLISVWERTVRRDRRYVTWEFTDDGSGVAAAIRISDQPLLVRVP